MLINCDPRNRSLGSAIFLFQAPGKPAMVISESGLERVCIRMFHKFPYCAYNHENRKENRTGRSPMAEYQSWGRVWIFWTDCNFILLSLHFSACETGPLVWMVSRAPSGWATVHSQITEDLDFFLNELFGLFILLGNDDNVNIRSSWVMWFENLHGFLCEFSAA